MFRDPGPGEQSRDRHSQNATLLRFASFSKLESGHGRHSTQKKEQRPSLLGVNPARSGRQGNPLRRIAPCEKPSLRAQGWAEKRVQAAQKESGKESYWPSRCLSDLGGGGGGGGFGVSRACPQASLPDAPQTAGKKNTHFSKRAERRTGPKEKNPLSRACMENSQLRRCADGLL